MGKASAQEIVLEKLKSSRYWKAVLIATVFALPLLALNLGIVYAKREWVSDDVIMQLAISDWHHGQPIDITFGDDTFILKFPFYAFIGDVMPHSPTAILVTVSAFLTLMLLLFNVFQFLFHRSMRFGTLLSMYLASFGGSAFYALAMTNTRNVEIPVALLTAVIVALYYRGKFRHVWWRDVLLILISALQMLNDPYCLYIFFIPMAAALFFTARERGRVAKGMFTYLVGSYLVWKIGVKILAAIGIHEFAVPLSFPTHTLLSATGYALQGLVYILGDKQGITAAHFWPALLATILLVGFLTAVFWSARREKVGLKKADPWAKLALCYGSLIVILNFVFYIASGDVEQSANNRYLIGSLFGFMILLIGLWMIGKNVTHRLIQALLCTFIVLNMAFNIQWAVHQPTVDNTQDANTLVAFSKKHNVKIGLADYWDADINTYYAQGQVKILPINCLPPTDFSQYYWVTNLANFIPVGQLSTARFFVYLNNQNNGVTTAASNRCSLSDFEMIFANRHLTVYNLGHQQTALLVD